MFKNYLKTAWRSIVRNKAFSLINITGLSIGIAASMLLFIVVKYELSYDTFQPNYDRIHRVVTEDKFDSYTTYNSGIPVAALKALRTDLPHIQFAALRSIYGSQLTIPSAGNATGNQFIMMLKDSSLISIMGVWELMYVSRAIGRADFKYMEMLIAAAIIYWILSAVLEVVQHKLERHYSRGARR